MGIVLSLTLTKRTNGVLFSMLHLKIKSAHLAMVLLLTAGLIALLSTPAHSETLLTAKGYRGVTTVPSVEYMRMLKRKASLQELPSGGNNTFDRVSRQYGVKFYCTKERKYGIHLTDQQIEDQEHRYWSAAEACKKHFNAGGVVAIDRDALRDRITGLRTGTQYSGETAYLIANQISPSYFTADKVKGLVTAINIASKTTPSISLQELRKTLTGPLGYKELEVTTQIQSNGPKTADILLYGKNIRTNTRNPFTVIRRSVDKILDDNRVESNTIAMLKSLGDHLGRPYDPDLSGTQREQNAARSAENDAMQEWFKDYYLEADVADLAASKGVVNIVGDINDSKLSQYVVFGVSGKTEIASNESYMSQPSHVTSPITIGNLVKNVSGLSYRKLNLAITRLPRFQ